MTDRSRFVRTTGARSCQLLCGSSPITAVWHSCCPLRGTTPCTQPMSDAQSISSFNPSRCIVPASLCSLKCGRAVSFLLPKATARTRPGPCASITAMGTHSSPPFSRAMVSRPIIAHQRGLEICPSLHFRIFTRSGSDAQNVRSVREVRPIYLHMHDDLRNEGLLSDGRGNKPSYAFNDAP